MLSGSELYPRWVPLKTHPKIVKKWFNDYRPAYRILSEQNRFYQNPYKTNDSVEALDFIEAFLNCLNIPKLSEKQRQSFEGRITTEECRTIIKKRSKTINHQGMMVSPFNF